jgi:hypothetical protein
VLRLAGHPRGQWFRGGREGVMKDGSWVSSILDEACIIVINAISLHLVDMTKGIYVVVLHCTAVRGLNLFMRNVLEGTTSFWPKCLRQQI